MTPGRSIPDELLLEQVAGGDESAFGELVRRHGDKLLAKARDVEPGLAEDVVQVALMNAYRAIRSGVRPVSLDAWLGAIVENAAVSELRRRRGEEPLAEVAFERSVFDEAADRDRIRRAVDATKQLPARERRALTAHAFEGRGHREIAAASGASEGSVRMAIHRARRRLRAAVPVLGPAAFLEGARRAAGRVRDAGALGGAAVAASVAAVATAAVVAGGLPGGGHAERSSVAVAQSPGASPTPTPTQPSVSPERSGDSSERRQGSKRDRQPDRGKGDGGGEDGTPPSQAATSSAPSGSTEATPSTQGAPADQGASSSPPSSGPSNPPAQPSPPKPSPQPPPADPPPPQQPSPPPAKCPGLVSCLLDEVGNLLKP